MEFLCNTGATKNLVKEDGSTPLLIASLCGHLDVVRFLCVSGVDRERSNQEGLNPMLAAALNGHLQAGRVRFEVHLAPR